jgi:hypothetical protein
MRQPLLKECEACRSNGGTILEAGRWFCEACIEDGRYQSVIEGA